MSSVISIVSMKDLISTHLLARISKNLSLWHNADNLIKAVAAVNPNTIVIAHSVGPSIIEPWIENPNVTAVCFLKFVTSLHIAYGFSLSCFGPRSLVKKQETRSLMFSMATTTPMLVLHTPLRRTSRTTRPR